MAIKSRNFRFYFITFFVLMFTITLIRTAWITDDAAITLRTALNFINGFGPRFNIEERVQAYTHPLWFLTLSLGAIISGNIFYATYFLSIVTSTTALALLLYYLPKNLTTTALLFTSSILSKAFIDFSTSGLENPLSHLLLVILILNATSCIEKSTNRFIAFYWTCAALYLNRQDLLLIILPLFVMVTRSKALSSREKTVAIFIGATPVVLWTAFSLFYYGFPFPNTAYAKLGTGIPMDEKVIQGFRYFLHSLQRDPLTLFIILLGVMIGLKGSTVSKSLSAGLTFYLLYLLSIGGDFMEGRFFSTPFFISIAIIARELTSKRLAIFLIIPVLALGSLNFSSNLLSGSSYSNKNISNYGIADERGFYFENFGLTNAVNRKVFESLSWTLNDRRVAIICGGLGLNSIEKGPGMHYIDVCALSDPLLARLPAKENPSWRIGHFIRQIPTNYKESLQLGENILADEKTKHYWNAIRSITRDPLLSINRLKEIAKVNLNLIEKPNSNMYKFGNIPRSTFSSVLNEREIRTEAGEGTSWDAPENFLFDNSIEILLAESKNIRLIDISVDGNDTYEIFGADEQGWHIIAHIYSGANTGLKGHRFLFEEPLKNIKRLKVVAIAGDGKYSLGHLLINARNP